MKIKDLITRGPGAKSSPATQDDLRKKVNDTYSAAAAEPQGRHPFPVGRRFAESIGYPPDLLDIFPEVVSDTFTGVSNVSIFAEIESGAAVLDIGCGAGLDSLIAARKTGPSGKVIGIDFSLTMNQKARQAAIDAGQENLEFYLAAAEDLPVREGSVDVILLNGIFNLNPYRDRIFKELFRTLKHGGRVYAAELLLKKPALTEQACSLDGWFS